jgi:large subunit ribosomal protein L21
MFAVIKTGGKQYRVAADDLLKVEKLAGDAGDIVEFSEILMVGEGESATVGTPVVEGALVTAEVVEQGRARKVIAFKKRRRKNSRRTHGHRQHLTTVRISEILTGGAKPTKKAAKPAPKKADEKPAAAKAEKPAEAKKEAAPKEEAPKKAPARKADAKKAEDKPAALFTAPEGEPDDLKKISGVGPVLEKKLHAFGVTKYAQVAAFKKKDIDALDEALSFKGRIERDDWVGQAAKLAKDAE